MSDADLSKLRFLVADETRYMRSVLRQQLKAFGVSVIHEAHDGQEAVEILKDRDVDFAIVDSGMSPVDGLAFTKHVRKGKGIPDQKIPIIVLIAQPDAVVIQAARDAGATEILSKPLSAKKLFERVQYSIKHAREFVKADDFTGPDRRRGRRGAEHRGEDRRGKPPPTIEI